MLGACGHAFASVSGTVVDADGKPIAKAKVAILRFNSRSVKTIPEIVYSDKEGKFFSKCDGNVQVTAAGYSVWGGYASSGNTQPIKLLPEIKQKGRVLNDAGKPVPGAKVGIESCYIYSSDGKYQSSYQSQQGYGAASDAVTGSDGSFTLRHLPNLSGGYRVTLTLKATKAGRAKITKYVQENEIGGDLTIVQPVECILQGHIANGDRSSVPTSNTLYVSLKSPGMSEVRSATINQDGYFRFSELPPAKARVSMISRQEPSRMSEWVLPATTETSLQPGNPITLNLVTVKAAKIEGTVIDKSTGNPVEGANLRVMDGSRASDMWMMERSDDKGQFRISVAPGDVSIAVQGFSKDRRYVYYANEDMPTIELAVAGGETKDGVRLEVTQKENVYDLYRRVDESKTDNELRLTPGTYTLSWDDNLDLSHAFFPESVRSREELQSKIKGLSLLISSKPYLSSYRLDGDGYDGSLVIVCDESKGTGTGYDTAYIDANRNWDISDDKPIKWKRDAGMGNSSKTSCVEVLAHQGDPNGDHADHPVMVSLSIYSAENYFQARPMIKGGWKGSIQSNRGPIEFIPIDANQNGRYGDISKSAKGEADCFAIDTNGIGQALPWTGSRHVLRANEVVSIANRLDNISVSDKGDKVTVKPYTGASGQIAVKASRIGGLDAKIVGMVITDGASCYTLHDYDSSLLLPAGHYSMESCDIVLQSAKLSNPRISVAVSDMFSIEPDKMSTFTIGGDVSASIDPAEKQTVFYSGQQGQFTWSLGLGKGATISNLGEMDRSRGVRVKLFDGHDKVVYSGGAGYT